MTNLKKELSIQQSECHKSIFSTKSKIEVNVMNLNHQHKQLSLDFNITDGSAIIFALGQRYFSSEEFKTALTYVDFLSGELTEKGIIYAKGETWNKDILLKDHL